MKKTGTILKEAREKKGISIYEVSTATKINTRNIMAMEEGAVDRLPPKTFLRGFVASYATFLQIDTAEILKIFFEEMGSTRPEIALREQLTGEAAKTDDTSKTDKSAVAALTDNKKIGYFKIYGIIGIVILIVVIGLIKRKMDSYESESIQITPVMNSAVAPSPTPSGAPVAIDVVAATASPISTATPESTATPAPMTTATPKPSATPNPSPTATPTPNPTPKPNPSPPPAGRPQEVMIEALDDVEVTVQIDSEPSKKMNLHHDEVQSLKARRKVSMKFSDGGAVNLTVNGKDRGVPGDLGKPKKVDVP